MPNRHRGELEKKYPQLPSIAASAADRRATSNKKKRRKERKCFWATAYIPPLSLFLRRRLITAKAEAAW